MADRAAGGATGSGVTGTGEAVIRPMGEYTDAEEAGRKGGRHEARPTDDEAQRGDIVNREATTGTGFASDEGAGDESGGRGMRDSGR